MTFSSGNSDNLAWLSSMCMIGSFLGGVDFCLQQTIYLISSDKSHAQRIPHMAVLKIIPGLGTNVYYLDHHW